MECGVKPFNRPSCFRPKKRVKHAARRRHQSLRTVELLENRRLLAADVAPPAPSIMGADFEDFETGDFTKFSWAISGDADWTITDDEQRGGVYSAQTGSISHTETSTLQVTLTTTASGEISFWRKVSSENSFDEFTFYLDGTQRGQWSGEVPWGQVTYPVPAGSHTFSWEYSKDGTVSRGSDTAWIDDIEFPPTGDPAPTVIGIHPTPGSTVSPGPLNVNVTFSEAVLGVDASDLVLSGVAAASASVGTPTSQGGNTWRFPLAGLVDGALNLSLAPDAGDIEDAAGQDLANLVWNYTVTTSTFTGEDFETGNFSRFPWTRSGDADWTITTAQRHGGAYSAQGGAISHGQTSTLEVSISAAVNGDISFWRKVSSESSFDYLRFYIDGTLQGQWSGEVPWGQVTNAVLAGSHTYTWEYSKDNSVSRGSDTAWLDDIVFPPVGDPVPEVTHINPLPGSQVGSGLLNVNVTFSEAVLGVDASDLVLSGAAAATATVGPPTNQGGNTWRFPLAGLVDGPLNLSLAPDAGDIEDVAGQDLANEVWSYIAATFEGEDFETGDFSNFPWGRFGNADWTVTGDEPYQGAYSAQAGSIDHDQKSTLRITLTTTEAGEVSFWRKVSSESNFDYLRFLIDGTLQNQWSGEVPWGQVTYPIPAGNHTFAWEYVKDSNISLGSDTAWLDNVSFPPLGDSVPSVIRIDPAHGSTIRSETMDVDVTFSEVVLGVDASDLQLSGLAANAATVATPIHQGGNTWRFPISGLTDGLLHVSLAPDAGDIVDLAGQHLGNEAWSYTVAYGDSVLIVPNYKDDLGEGFFDPVLGPARRQALEYALVIWQELLSQTYDAQTIVVDVTMDPLGGSSTGAVLASAGSPSIHRNYPGMVPDKWYGAALANQIVGEDVFGLSEIQARFNSDVDSGTVLGSRDWYYGLDAQPGDDFDFVTVVLHEVGHGLNFFDVLNSDGTWTNTQPGIYDSFLEIGDGTRVVDMATASSRAAALVSDDLWWGGAEGTAGNGGTRPRIYAPDPYRSGSSTSHVDESTHRTALMSPTYSSANHVISAMEQGMMLDMGWVIILPGSAPVALPRPVTGQLASPESLNVDRRYSTKFNLPGNQFGVLSDVAPTANDLRRIAAGANATVTAIDSLMEDVDTMTPGQLDLGATNEIVRWHFKPTETPSPMTPISLFGELAEELSEHWDEAFDVLALDVATAALLLT